MILTSGLDVADIIHVKRGYNLVTISTADASPENITSRIRWEKRQ
ncbi:hypothetical protein [Marinifaba aquimaris]|nr:hypothetical protein [Marinifaba aquimaris]